MPTVHFDWTITAGNVISIALLGAVLRVAHKIYKAVMVWMAEHEVLVSDFCQRHGLTREEFNSRAMLVLATVARRRGNGHANGASA